MPAKWEKGNRVKMVGGPQAGAVGTVYIPQEYVEGRGEVVGVLLDQPDYGYVQVKAGALIPATDDLATFQKLLDSTAYHQAGCTCKIPGKTIWDAKSLGVVCLCGITWRIDPTKVPAGVKWNRPLTAAEVAILGGDANTLGPKEEGSAG